MNALQVKIWEEKARAVVEERSKHKSALETELRNLKAAQDDLASKFDCSLLTLQRVSHRAYSISQISRLAVLLVVFRP